MSLALDHVTVTVPDGDDTLTILDGVSLKIDPGETVALTGASGSGKSTLLAVAGLLRRPTAGTVHIAGSDATAANRKGATRLRRDHVGIVYQSANLFPALTALEQVELVAHIAGGLDAPARARARELLVTVGLEKKLAVRPQHLSGGERQRVGIARALMNEPSILLADEPTASLDPERGQAVMDLLLSEAQRRQTAALIVTHAHEQAAQATRHLRIAAGQLHSTTAPTT